MIKVKIYPNSTDYDVDGCLTSPTSVPDYEYNIDDVRADDPIRVYEVAEGLLKDGKYEFNIVDEKDNSVLGITCYYDAMYGKLRDIDNDSDFSWFQYGITHPDIWDRYESELAAGMVREERTAIQEDTVDEDEL